MTSITQAVEFDADDEETFVPALGETHSARAKQILRDHPEIRGLIGRNPWTAAVTAAYVGIQLAVAVAFGWAGASWWWLALIVAYGFGAFLNHGLYVVVHDATHNLIFRSRFANRVVLLVADIPQVLPGAMGFRACHLAHHSHLGEMDGDTDIPHAWEARLIGHSTWRKAMWFLFFPVFQVLRVTRVRGVATPDRWMIANYVVNFGFAGLLGWFAGWTAVLYLFASFWFAISLHPLGARWVQEHFTGDEVHDTANYYGPLNGVALNIGYHNEHHDFPSIPWNRLPEVTRIAPDYYLTLPSHRSWTKLLIGFITDPAQSLWTRTVRPEAGGRAAGA
ncbi:MAG: fatty acid desaturase [Phreatobacter sp.]|uniref:fatty acid desaturase n=1 Tax=Phreatobacter sp. TaxID=1966341 RepID=UPI002733EC0D|nr:fatty acid desaturase [Phreatobacter sp.]MDP2803634.1 fatty acid desaturase [Phreatobacter sp.]